MFWRKGQLRGCFTARGESLAAFDGRCIPAGCVAPRSNTPGILGRRALPAGRLARLGATPDFHHGLLERAAKSAVVQSLKSAVGADLKVPTTLRFVPFVSLVFNRMPRQGVFMAVGGLGFLVQLAALAALTRASGAPTAETLIAWERHV